MNENSEKKEIEQTILDAVRSNRNRAIGLGLAALSLLLVAALYRVLDVTFTKDGIHPSIEVLASELELDAASEAETYQFKSGRSRRQISEWPIWMYHKLKRDIFTGFILIIVAVFALIYAERARSSRKQLLLYRSLAREIELLRTQLKSQKDKQ